MPERGYAVPIMGRLPLRLRVVLAQRKWILWVALLLILAIVLQVGVSLLLPHHVLDTLLKYEEQSNGARELRGGVREGGGSG
jgi:hypothetical protein